MADVFDVVNYILEISREESEDGEFELISHMKLQKLIFFCQGFSLSFLDKPLFSEPIEAWPQGPVYPKLYHLLKGYGACPITSTADPQKIALDDDEKSLIDMVYDVYGQYSAAKLRKITHKMLEETQANGEIDMSKFCVPNGLYSMVIKRPWTDEERSDAKRILEEIAESGDFDLSPFYAQD